MSVLKSVVNSYLSVKAFGQDHVEGYLELSAKTKIYFATAVAMWDAEFYIKVDDDVHVNIGTFVYISIISVFCSYDNISLRCLCISAYMYICLCLGISMCMLDYYYFYYF